MVSILSQYTICFSLENKSLQENDEWITILKLDIYESV